MTFKALCYPLLALLGGCFESARYKHPPTPYVIENVPHSTTQGTFHRFDILADAKGRIHLVWQTAVEGLLYQTSHDGTQTWSEPVLLAEAHQASRSGFYSLLSRPRVFVDGDTVVALWQEPPNGDLTHRVLRKVSRDGGRTWTEEPGEPPELYGRLDVRYVLLAEGRTIYLAAKSQDGFTARRSDDLGAHWTASAHIAPYQGAHMRNEAHVALTHEEGRLYVLMSEWPGLLRLAESVDEGIHWSPPVVIPIELAQFGPLILSVTLEVSGNALQACFTLGSNIFCQMLDQTGKVLREPQRITTHTSRARTDIGVLAEPDGSLRVAWTDGMYKEKSWINKTPLVFLTFDGPERNWANNDLFINTVKGGVAGTPEVVTPHLSFVSGQGGQGPQFLRLSPERLYVFWSGRQKVGKTRDSYGYPTELLYTALAE